MTQVSQAVFDRIARAQARKAKRVDNAAFQASVGAINDPKRLPGRPVAGRKPKKRAPIARKAVVKRLDAVFSLFIRLRDKKVFDGLCVLCRKRPIEVCFHWVSRGNFATRWLPGNACGSCRGCNYEETFRKQKYRDMHIARVGLTEREELEVLARAETHFTTAELLEKIECFKAYLEAA